MAHSPTCSTARPLSRAPKDGRAHAGVTLLPPLSFARRLRLATDLARGVAFLHGLQPPLIHRDLKPQNCLIDHAGALKIADLGLSRLLDSGLQRHPGSSTSGTSTTGTSTSGSDGDACSDHGVQSGAGGKGATAIVAVTDDVRHVTAW